MFSPQREKHLRTSSKVPFDMRDVNDIESNRPPSQRYDDRGVSQEKSGSPEMLVRDDTWWINCLRVFLIGTLVVVATGISTATYKILSKLERETFRNEFESVAAQLTQAFLQDMNLKLWISSFSTLAVSLDGNFPSADIDFLDKVSFGVGDLSYWNRLGFSPLLWTRNDRRDWEAEVKSSNQHTNNNICHVCGEGMEVGSPASDVNIPGFGTFPCSMIDDSGLKGQIPRRNCPFLKDYMDVSCQCRPVSTSAGQAMNNTNVTAIASQIFRINEDGQAIPDNGPPPFSPIWQASPPALNQALLYNQMSDPLRRQAIKTMIETKLPTFGPTRYPSGGGYQWLVGETEDAPFSTIFYPIIDTNTTKNRSVIGSIAMDFPWSSIFGYADRIPRRSSGVVFVLENTQGQTFTFKISDNLQVAFVGKGDLHAQQFDSMMKGSSYDDLVAPILVHAPEARKHVPDSTLLYKIGIYPSESFERQFVTRKPIYYTIVVASIFVFTSAIFILYDKFVRRRQFKVMQAAVQSNAIVTSVFPEFITSRLMNNATSLASPGKVSNQRQFSPLPFGTAKHQLRILLGTRSEGAETAVFGQPEPIADFFPNVTVLFADIAGFTAWSSEREPVQVFQLLESVYQTFDAIAAKHDVFKVETIGDCYVAVTGLPIAQPDHAVRMARFAYEIMRHMHELAASLESLLGPGTGSLSIRVGLHSGSVTGGVLRGDKARFQLFGDTMNTSARMESTGEVNRIQASDSTAALLREAGYASWVERRESKVFVKGKGDMQTFWIDVEWQEPSNTIVSDPVEVAARNSVCDIMPPPDIGLFSKKKGSTPPETNNSLERLVNWNTDLLERFLNKLVAARAMTSRRNQRRSSRHFGGDMTSWNNKPIDDVTEVIDMAKFSEKMAENHLDPPDTVEIGENVRSQLRTYVERIAGMYRDNAFHNFEHASHVAMSANKILKRIIKPEGIDYEQQCVRKKDRKKALAELIHNSTFGISSDALMQFAVIFSAVIHDVDHTGVSNAQLVKEKDELAMLYNDKCVAEQNSVQIAWDVLMEEPFSDLRTCIYITGDEKSRFRQLIVNAVIATDIADAELQALRKNRWYNAFYDGSNITPDRRLSFGDEMSCKATVVFEYIIQASDVAHTMQHWHVYNRWNERLFEERYVAYLAGREEKDPSVGWYNGEIWFFDNYIIPLARKLETCGVFGVSSDEYLNYALANRHEWERRGHEIVEELKEKYSPSNLAEKKAHQASPSRSYSQASLSNMASPSTNRMSLSQSNLVASTPPAAA